MLRHALQRQISFLVRYDPVALVWNGVALRITALRITASFGRRDKIVTEGARFQFD